MFFENRKKIIKMSVQKARTGFFLCWKILEEKRKLKTYINRMSAQNFTRQKRRGQTLENTNNDKPIFFKFTAEITYQQR
jgi:hypothetical protein